MNAPVVPITADVNGLYIKISVPLAHEKFVYIMVDSLPSLKASPTPGMAVTVEMRLLLGFF